MLPKPQLTNPVHLLAFGFGSGCSPKAPGTMGTLVAVPIYLGLAQLPLGVYIVALVAVIGAGIWICGRAASDLNTHDHPGIVWDEIAGYLITMTGLPNEAGWVLAGFALFRLFDIWKPWPIGWLDRRVSGGLGIMADDVVAGALALACLQGVNLIGSRISYEVMVMRVSRSIVFMVLFVAGLTAAPSMAADPVIRVLALFSGKAMLSIDGQRRLLSHGETSPEGVELIDANADRALLRVGNERISLEPGGVVSAQFAKPVHREVRIVRDRSGAYLSGGTINGRRADFLVDTGASSVAMNEVLARRLGIDYERKGRRINLQTAAGMTQGYVVTLAKVRIGEIELRDVEGSVVLGAGPTQVLLGMSFLGRVKLENRGNMLLLRHSR